MKAKSVLLDTSFFIRFLKEDDPLFNNTDEYYRYFLEKDIPMIISTISIAEYCVGGNINELPLKDLQILPLNVLHAQRAGEFAKIVFQNRNKLKLNERNIIPNDTKLFSQADIENQIGYYISSDIESFKIYNLLKNETSVKFEFIDLNIKHSESFGLLEFD